MKENIRSEQIDFIRNLDKIVGINQKQHNKIE